ncbi:GntR family transcriptional regulator [Nonomuraea sp. AD125B]|uniref:GntR family transcriptional regulator n=1 Tax=Nonomuraea sp. AD125B TaxID=3242897 RepID=UPI003528694E
MLNPRGPVPLYRQLANLLQKRIDDGELQPSALVPSEAARVRAGDFQQDVPLPSETQLAQHYEVAKGTVRRALSVLRDQGLVFTVSGRGTYPSP